MFQKVLFLGFSFLGCMAYGMEKPKEMLLSHEDKDAYPWVKPLEKDYV